MALQKYSGLPKNKVVGMAGILDSSRFIYFLSQELKVPPQQIKSFVLGGHGDSMVAMLNSTTVNGRNIFDLVNKYKFNFKLELIKKMNNKNYYNLVIYND